MEWKKVKLGEVAVSIQTGPFGSQLHESDYSSDGIPVIMPKDIINWRVSDNSIARVDEEHINRLSRHKVKYEDIVYPRRGDVGKCALITKEQNNWLCGTGCMKIEINKEFAFPSFIFYQLQQWDVRKWIEKNATGATMPNLNTSIVARIPISLPPLPYQRRISSILSDYDSLIENYQRQISLLEESAKHIYKEWFVDFKFPGVEMAENGLPKGWQKKKLGEICESITRTSNDLKEQLIFLNTGDVENGEILHSNYSPTKEMPGQAKKLIKKNDILYSEIRPINRHFAYVNFDCEDYIVSTKLMVIKAKDGINSRRLYQFLTFDDTIKALQIEAESRSGTFPQIRFENVSKLHLIIGDERIEKEYDCVLSDFFTKIENMKTQIRLLRQNRDILLPRLMNGEIEVEG